jgi:hypothetical protein
MKANKITEWSDAIDCIDIKTNETSSYRARRHDFGVFDVVELDSSSVVMFIPFRDGAMVGRCGFPCILDAITEALKEDVAWQRRICCLVSGAG